jgi:hypothetical protein
MVAVRGVTMDLEALKSLLGRITGCTFASIDADFEPRPGFRKVVKNEVVLLYRTKGVSGYENMVRRRLVDVGRDASQFTVGELPWGERVDNLPLIAHDGKTYLQTILVKPGEIQAFIGPDIVQREVDPALFPDIFLRTTDILKAARAQGLPAEKAVVVRTYNIESLTEIRLMHEKITR